MYFCVFIVIAFFQAVGQDIEDNESVLEAVNQEAFQLLAELRQGDGLVDMEGFEAQLRLVNETWNEAKIQVTKLLPLFLCSKANDQN